MIQLLNTFRNLMVKCLNLHTNTAQANSLSVKTIYESKSYFWQYKKKLYLKLVCGLVHAVLEVAQQQHKAKSSQSDRDRQ